MIFTCAVPSRRGRADGPARRAVLAVDASIHGGDPAMARLAARAAKVLDR